MTLRSVLVIIMMGWLATACGVVPRTTQPAGTGIADDGPRQSAPANSDDDTNSDSGAENGPSDPPSAMKVSSINEVKASLMQAYRDWEGTPYQLGGATLQGVDCSRLVNIVFDDYLGIELPTHTRKQLYAGTKIRRAAIRTGDLVFFRTGRKTLHVGIAVNSGEFLHASTSSGVMISKLGKRYWRERFLAARRVL